MIIIIEIPSVPKSLVININSIAVILIFAMIIMVSFWHFIPLFTEPLLVLPSGSLNVEFGYITKVHPGDEWVVNLSVNNDGGAAVHNITIQLVGDNVIEGAQKYIEAILPLTTREFKLKSRIKDDAPLGNHTVHAIVVAEGTIQKQRKLQITVIER